MNKKTIILSLICVAGFLILVSPKTASAYSTYVGMKIESVYNPVYGTTEAEHAQWCIPIGATMTIKLAGTTIPNGTVTTTKNTGNYAGCQQQTIWSNLVDLTSTTTYSIVLGTTKCAGVSKYGYCWFCGALGETCDTVCTNRGASPCVDPGTADASITCADIASMCGITCSTCYTATYCPMAYDLPAYCWTDCYILSASCAGSSTCNAIYYWCSAPSTRRICSCTGAPLTYTFSFTAP